ncbi:MAG: THUMP domain-containing protein [Gemmatimonadota bacterium]|nr:class I SAM-dependent RNA methyltransferase [Gemmatimonadota bacterium]
MSTPDRSSFAAFAVTAPGLAPLAARELSDLGLGGGRVSAEGVELTTDLAGLCRANLGLRTVSRVLVRVARFPAAHFNELEKAAAAVDWGRWIAPGRPVRLRVTSAKSRLYHQRAVAERLLRVLGAPAASSDAPDEETPLLVVRIVRDRCTLSLDSSGALLHRRGYRLDSAKAPLRETLAAALVLALEWEGERPLLDPFCGSGTIAIEAALRARRLAPGRGRGFAFEAWPGFRPDVLANERERAAAAERPLDVPILASDRDRGAVAAAHANAERAGVSADLRIERRPVSDLQPPASPGLLLANPPYGVRVRGGRDLRDLYDRLGQVLRGGCAGWDVGLLSGDVALTRRVGIPLETRLQTSNGGLAVTLLAGRVPDAGPAG